jgi:hypothetical protein
MSTHPCKGQAHSTLACNPSSGSTQAMITVREVFAPELQ